MSKPEGKAERERDESDRIKKVEDIGELRESKAFIKGLKKSVRDSKYLPILQSLTKVLSFIHFVETTA